MPAVALPAGCYRRTDRTATIASTSFYGPVPPLSRDDLLGDYLAFLDERDGPVDDQERFAHREEWLSDAAANAARHPRPMEQREFERHFAGAARHGPQRYGESSSRSRAICCSNRSPSPSIMSFVRMFSPRRSM